MQLRVGTSPRRALPEMRGVRRAKADPDVVAIGQRQTHRWLEGSERGTHVVAQIGLAPDGIFLKDHIAERERDRFLRGGARKAAGFAIVGFHVEQTNSEEKYSQTSVHIKCLSLNAWA